MNKTRLDQELVVRGLVSTRSQAETYIKLGYVLVDSEIVDKPGFKVSNEQNIKLNKKDKYVSRAALKLESVANEFRLDFRDKIVLDVGSSTGGFTDYALHHEAKKVIAVEIGTEQLHPTLRKNKRIELHEQTDIRNFYTKDKVDIVVIDVSFITIRDILPHIRAIINDESLVIAMVKPQFEAVNNNLKHKGVIKNDRLRRQILVDFEQWVKQRFYIEAKSDSKVAGEKGNLERFYLLRKL